MIIHLSTMKPYKPQIEKGSDTSKIYAQIEKRCNSMTSSEAIVYLKSEKQKYQLWKQKENTFNLETRKVLEEIIEQNLVGIPIEQTNQIKEKIMGTVPFFQMCDIASLPLEKVQTMFQTLEHVSSNIKK